MERENVEVLLEEKLIELLKTSIAFDSRSNRNKTYSLLGEASSKRSVEETKKLIDLIDKQIRSFEADSIKNYFNENASKYNVFKDDIDLFVKSLDKNDETMKEENTVDDQSLIEDVNKTVSVSEDGYNRLTRDEIDGFMKSIDDKLAELEAEASALENISQ